MRSRPRWSRSSRLAPLLIALACSGGSGGGGGGPTTPDPPAVTGVTPAQALVGESITIQGSNLGSSASAVSVTVRGQAAEVESVTEAAIVATVPTIAPGAAPVAVTVGGAAAGEVAFTILQTTPSITALEGAPFRAGGEITIRGEGFLPPVGSLAPAVDPVVTLSSTVDPQTVETLPIQNRDFTQIVAQIPGVVTPGTYDVNVQVGTQTATERDVDVFIVDGLQGSFAASGRIDANAINAVPVGRQLDFDFTLRETGIIDVTTKSGTFEGTLNGVIPVIGEFDAFSGAFELESPVVRDKTWFFTGSVAREGGDLVVRDGRIRVTEGANELRFELGAAVAWHLEPVLTGTLAISYGDIVNGNGTFPSATYQYDAYEPLSWDPVTMIAGQLTGNWFQSTQPRRHIGTFDGTLRAFYGGVQIEGTSIAVVRAFWTPLNSSQDVVMEGFDAAGQPIVDATFSPVDNQGATNPFSYTLTSPFAGAVIEDFEIRPAGNGFTAALEAGVNWIQADRVDLGPARVTARYRDFR